MNEKLFGLITKENVPVPLTGVEVYSDIAGRSARVKVIQRYTNNEDKAVESIYKFPLPENASLCGFSVTADGKVITGEIEERGKAFDLYDKALSQGHGAYLLDEERPNIFTISAGNINPGIAVIIEIIYVTLLDTNNSEVRFFLPTAISPRYIPDYVKDKDGIPVTKIVNPEFAINVPYGMRLIVDIHGKEGIASIQSPSHPIVTSYGGDSIRAEFSSDVTEMDRDFILSVTYRDGFESNGLYLSSGEEGFYQIDFTCDAEESEGKEQPIRKEIIFVLDCSGSMGGSSIAEAKKALEILLKALKSNYIFNIYCFGSAFNKLFPLSTDYTESSLKKALLYVSKIRADLGGTELLAPLKDIYDSKLLPECQRNIILITDGEIGNESDIYSLVKGAANKARIFSVGIGNGPNEYFIKQIARDTKGAAELVSPRERIEPKVLRLYKKIVTESIDNIVVHWEEQTGQVPASPVAYCGETITVFGKAPSFNAQVRITGSISGRSKEWLVPVRRSEGDDNPIPALWAREMIRELEEGGLTNAGSRQTDRKEQKLKDELVALSKQYGIVSRETSYIAVEKREDKDKTAGEVILRKIPVMLTRGWGGIDSCYADNISQKYYADGCHSIQFSTTTRLYNARPRPAGDTDSDVPAFLKMRTTPPPDTKPRFMKTRAYSIQEIINKMLSLQRFEGGFEIDSNLADMLNLQIKYIKKASKKIVGKYKTNGFALLSTALILAILEKRYTGEKNQWWTVTEKSRKWLELEIKTKAPAIGGIPLADWVKNDLEK